MIRNNSVNDIIENHCPRSPHHRIINVNIIIGIKSAQDLNVASSSALGRDGKAQIHPLPALRVDELELERLVELFVLDYLDEVSLCFEGYADRVPPREGRAGDHLLADLKLSVDDCALRREEDIGMTFLGDV